MSLAKSIKETSEYIDLENNLDSVLVFIVLENRFSSVRFDDED